LDTLMNFSILEPLSRLAEASHARDILSRNLPSSSQACPFYSGSEDQRNETL
jgi:hypothetical protein